MIGTAYYNEIDPYAAKWLRNLIVAGHIAPGYVDETDIRDVKPDFLAQFIQHHFFAGIGVWSYALRRAGWPDNVPIWTGSCPCQPFSSAGGCSGFTDERHLWPAWFHLITQHQPAIIVGEQVASADAEHWIDLVQADMEGLGHAFGAIPFPSAGVGAPHMRDRIYWMAKNLADPESERRSRIRRPTTGEDQRGTTQRSETGHPTAGFWRDADWITCSDGKSRAVEPGTFPLVDGNRGSLGRLRAYGNAINADAARVWIECVMSC